MTLNDLAHMDKSTVTVEEIGPVVGIRPHTLRLQARKDPARLGFPVCVAGNTVRIPREAFIAWMRGQTADQHHNAMLGS